MLYLYLFYVIPIVRIAWSSSCLILDTPGAVFATHWCCQSAFVSVLQLHSYIHTVNLACSFRPVSQVLLQQRANLLWLRESLARLQGRQQTRTKSREGNVKGIYSSLRCLAALCTTAFLLRHNHVALACLMFDLLLQKRGVTGRLGRFFNAIVRRDARRTRMEQIPSVAEGVAADCNILKYTGRPGVVVRDCAVGRCFSTTTSTSIRDGAMRTLQ
jgi:hypothetical protein